MQSHRRWSPEQNERTERNTDHEHHQIHLRFPPVGPGAHERWPRPDRPAPISGSPPSRKYQISGSQEMRTAKLHCLTRRTWLVEHCEQYQQVVVDCLQPADRSWFLGLA
jgi:hypothetical protein